MLARPLLTRTPCRSSLHWNLSVDTISTLLDTHTMVSIEYTPRAIYPVTHSSPTLSTVIRVQCAIKTQKKLFVSYLEKAFAHRICTVCVLSGLSSQVSAAAYLCTRRINCTSYITDLSIRFRAPATLSGHTCANKETGVCST